MEFREVVRRRRMVRAFADLPVSPELVDGLIDDARRAPSAGNTAAMEFLVLEGREQTGEYWGTTLPPGRREGFAWPGLLVAPVLVLPWVHPEAYVARYREPDKAHTGLGEGVDAWPVPYWCVAGGAAVRARLSGAVDRGLGALLFGMFDHEAAVRARFGVPRSRRAVGVVALGHPADDRASGSSLRGRPPLATVVHRSRWDGD
ncbi:MAG: nitroreductase family protein [Acidimicrobiales bacterium]